MDDTTLEHPVDAEGPPGEAVVAVDIEASPCEVWEALTTDEGLARWIGDGSTIGDQPGDDLHVHDVVTGKNRRGVLDEVTPLRRIGYTWWPETNPERATRVAISLEPCPGGTRVTVVESQPTLAPLTAPTAVRAQACTGGAWYWRLALLAVGQSTLPILA